MAGQIRITPDQMRTRSREYQTQAENLDKVISRMDTLLNDLQSEWEGASSEAFANRFAELRPGFIKAKELIEEIASSLDATANDIEVLDQDIASKYGG